jgi:hypothetical protein
MYSSCITSAWGPGKKSIRERIHLILGITSPGQRWPYLQVTPLRRRGRHLKEGLASPASISSVRFCKTFAVSAEILDRPVGEVLLTILRDVFAEVAALEVTRRLFRIIQWAILLGRPTTIDRRSHR